MKQLQQILSLFFCLIAPSTIFGQEESIRTASTNVSYIELPASIHDMNPSCLSKNLQNSSGQNFISNGNFADGELNKLPVGWQLVTPNLVLAPTFKLVKGDNGEKLVMAQGNGRKECIGYIRQKFTIPENKAFLMRVVFRIEGIEDVNRNLVHGIYGDFNNGIFKYHREGKWIVGEHRFPGKGKNCEARLYFRFSPKGKVWWKEISITECDPIPPRLVNIAVSNGVRDKKGWEAFLDSAGRRGCDVALMGEFFVPGDIDGIKTKILSDDVKQNNSYINEMNGPAMQMMSAKAKEWHMYISGTIRLRLDHEDVIHNSAPLYDRKGELVGIYSKVNLYDPELDDGTSPGESVPVFKTDFGTVGIMICYDSWHPEVARLLALKGAEIILFPSAGYYLQLLHARSADNGVVVAATSADFPCGVWDAGGNRAGVTGDDDSRHAPTQIVAFEENKEQKMQFVTVDLSIEASPHYWGGPMLSAPGGRRVRATGNFYLEDEIEHEVRRWESE
jgi:predicted amidohydrolase